MVWQPALIAAVVALGTPASAEGPLEELARRAISVGLPNRVPGPIAELLDLQVDAPVHQLKIQKEQSTDGRHHLFQVLVELSTGTPRRPLGPIGLVLSSHRVNVNEGTSDRRWFRSTLEGTLERAMRIQGRVDEHGQSIKGAGIAKKEDVESPEVKEAFQHELELWLRKTHLKKEWRSAEFSGGVLKKKSKRR